jgi:8-oxo-dGTP pyrophosphatase MutT (NUDIX family)
MFCSHAFCRKEPKGVAVCIVDPDKKQVLLGRERFGKYRDKFNLCAGSLEPEDGGCAILAAKRELREEFKLCLDDFDSHFALRRRNMWRLVMVGTTPVLIGHFNTNALPTAGHLTDQMKAAIENETLPGTHKEMGEARWFSWDEHDTMAWSRFARVVLKKILQRSSREDSSYKNMAPHIIRPF